MQVIFQFTDDAGNVLGTIIVNDIDYAKVVSDIWYKGVEALAADQPVPVNEHLDCLTD